MRFWFLHMTIKQSINKTELFHYSSIHYTHLLIKKERLLYPFTAHTHDTYRCKHLFLIISDIKKIISDRTCTMSKPVVTPKCPVT